MGMDLLPRHKGVRPFAASWMEWSALINFVETLGGDVSMASGSNDGEYIDAKTLKGWAKLIESVDLRRVYGMYDHIGEPVLRVDTDGYRLFQWQNEGLKPCPVMMFHMYAASLRAFAAFCRDAGGCWQH